MILTALYWRCIEAVLEIYWSGTEAALGLYRAAHRLTRRLNCETPRKNDLDQTFPKFSIFWGFVSKNCFFCKINLFNLLRKI